jgi:hypothetical protein
MAPYKDLIATSLFKFGFQSASFYMFQLIMGKTLSLTSLHAFIACIAALVWQLTNVFFAFGHLQLSSKDLSIAALYICVPVLLILLIGLLDQV